MKHIWKRLLCMALCLCLAAGILPGTATAAEVIERGTCGGSLKWELTDDGVLRIYGSGAMPDTLCTDPSPFASIAGKIKQVVIEEGVTDIGINAFQGCRNLTHVQIPDSVLSIGDQAFYYATHLVSIEIPAGVRAIESGAFSGCSFLKHIWFSGNAPQMNPLMMANTPAVTAYYPANNPTWSQSVRQDYDGNITWVPVDMDDNLEVLGFGKIGDNVHWYLDSSGLLKIFGQGDMWNYENATDLPWWDLRPQILRARIEPGITGLSDFTFCRCTAMTEVTLPASLEHIGTQAFSGSGIATVNLDPANTALRCEDNVIYTPDMTEIVAMPGLYSGHYVLPETVRVITEYEFAHQTAMTGISLHGGLTRLDTAAFWDCTALTEITIPAGVTYIGYYAFRDCDSLISIRFLGEAPEIEYNAFYGLELDGYYPKDLVSWEQNTWHDFSGRMNWIPDDGQHRHSYTTQVIAPTCTEAGYTLSTCSGCGDSFRTEEVPALGHDFAGRTCTRCGAQTGNPFSDVPGDAYFLEPVLWAVDRNITAGTGNGNFSPNQTCTRGQVVTFLWRAAGQPEPSSHYNPFTDVTEKDYFYKSVLWAVENGITSGLSATTFGPASPCSRGQVVTFLWRAAGKQAVGNDTGDFSDVTKADYFFTPVLWAVENGVTSGVGGGRFAPNDPCTRGQVVTFLYRAFANR